jgi:hypothetical protein
MSEEELASEIEKQRTLNALGGFPSKRPASPFLFTEVRGSVLLRSSRVRRSSPIGPAPSGLLERATCQQQVHDTDYRQDAHRRERCQNPEGHSCYALPSIASLPGATKFLPAVGPPVAALL